MGTDKNALRKRRIYAGATVFIAMFMLGLSFASVPLYRLFCSVTGYGGTPQIAKAAPAQQGTRELVVQFDANVAAGLPWRLVPDVSRVTARTGATLTVFYTVTNLSDRETYGMASYNVTPDQSGAYFSKIACFCFSEQRLGPREQADWPVVFFLDPALESDEAMKNVESITLSYTIFAAKPSGAAASGKSAETIKPGI